MLPQRTIKIKQRQDNIEFAAMVEAVDQSLGRVMKKLEELGQADNTIVIFASDNGGMSAVTSGTQNELSGTINSTGPTRPPICHCGSQGLVV